MKGFGKTGLRNFQNDRKVFVGGMPPNNTSKEINMKLKEIREGVENTCPPPASHASMQRLVGVAQEEPPTSPTVKP
eukprot:s961_g4.t1